MEIQFYHLLTTPLERALPKLMEKAFRSGQRVMIHCTDEEQMKLLDATLWTYDANRFLPHGLADAPRADEQPICLSLGMDNPNQATIGVVVNGATLPMPSAYSKVLDLFDGHDEGAVAAARTRWKNYQQSGAALSYIQQQKGGGWQVAAKSEAA